MKPVPWWREPTRGQWMSFLAAWLGWILDGFDFTIFLLLMPHIAQEFGVSMTAAAGSVTLTLLVRLLGGVAAGSLADRFGRKLPLMLSLVWFALCDGAVAFAPTFGWILFFRTIFGFGMGAEWTAGMTLAMENWPARSRGLASGVLQGSWAIGYLLAAEVTGLVLTQTDWGWRSLFLIAAAPALLVLPIRFWVPESPEWLKNAALRAKTPKVVGSPAPAAEKWLTAENVKKLAWSSVVMGLGFAVYYALVGMYPTMLIKELGLSTQEMTRMVSLFNVGFLGGAIVCGVLATKKGPIIAIALPALAVLPFLPMYVGVWPKLLGLGAFMGGAVGVGYSGVTPVLLTTLFPASSRGKSVGVVYHVGAFFAAFAPPTVAALSEHAGLTLAHSIALVAGVLEVLLIASLFIQPKAFRTNAPVAVPAAAPAEQTPPERAAG